MLSYKAQRVYRLSAIATLVACVGIFNSGSKVRARSAAIDEVLNWNTIAVTLTPAGGKGAIPQSRIYAMVQLAVHDALNAITRRYEPYVYTGDADANASPAAAVATAAHDVLAQEVPLQAANIDSQWSTSLAAIPDSAAKDEGIALGHAAAQAMLDARAGDGSAVVTPYTPGTGPGEWRPTPNPIPPSPPGADLLPAAFPGWGNVTPFALNNGEQFRPDGPPELTSDRYTQDYEEVRAIGEQFSSIRTTDQSEIARFWYEGSPLGWNRIARNVAAGYSLDLWEEARLLALVHVAMADGFIAGFNAKYYFNFWRPVTAIREGDTDDNPQTVPDPAWSTYLDTPAIPDYPSTHSVLGAAAAEAIARFFGRDDIAFSTTSGAPFVGITRSFSSLSMAAAENADSRVFAGIHFRSACNDGLDQGKKIGRFVALHGLKSVDH